VLRRAPRPPPPADVRVARARDGEAPPPEDPSGAPPRAWRHRAAASEAAAAAARADTLEGLLDDELGDGADADGEAEEDEEGAALESALRELMVGSVRGSDDEDEAGAAGAEADAAAGRAGGPSAALAAELAAELEAARGARAAAAAARRRGGPRPGPPALGRGAGGGRGEEAEAEGGGDVRGRHDAWEPGSPRDARGGAAAAAAVEAADADEDEDADKEEEGDAEEWRSSEDVWRERDAPALAAAAAAAAGWARIVRPPRKRSGHVVLDLCTAARRAPPDGDATSGGGAAPELGSGSGLGLAGRGELVQQVVAAADKRAWLGPAGYRLARKARWGDLWPRWYEDRAITVRGGFREPQEGQ